MGTVFAEGFRCEDPTSILVCGPRVRCFRGPLQPSVSVLSAAQFFNFLPPATSILAVLYLALSTLSRVATGFAWEQAVQNVCGGTLFSWGGKYHKLMGRRALGEKGFGAMSFEHIWVTDGNQFTWAERNVCFRLFLVPGHDETWLLDRLGLRWDVSLAREFQSLP